MAATLGWTPEAGSAVICVIVVMKMVISYTDNSLRPGGNELKSVRAQGEAERKNVLLRYAWHDTSKGVEESSGIGPDAVLRLQEEVYTELMDPQGQWSQVVSRGVTFEGLMESAPMCEHFWSRLELRMQIGLEVEQKDGWMPLQPAMVSGTTIPMSAAALARQSLLCWSPDTGSLEARILDNPTRFDEKGRGFQQVHGWSLGAQKCIRVLYDTGSGLDGPGFQDLVAVSTAPKVLETVSGEQGARWTDGDAQTYRLIAVVRLGTPEYLRIYDKAGMYGVPRDLPSQAMLCLNNDWELGQSGFKYMLYYARANSTDPGVESAQERPPSDMSKTGDLRAARIHQPSFPLQSISRLPTPRPDLPGPHLTEANLVPLGRSRARWSGGESPAGPSGQHGGSVGGTHPPMAPSTTGNVTPLRLDTRPRSDQPGTLPSSQTSIGNFHQSLHNPRRTTGIKVEDDRPDSMWAGMSYAEGSPRGHRRKKRRMNQDDM